MRKLCILVMALIMLFCVACGEPKSDDASNGSADGLNGATVDTSGTKRYVLYELLGGVNNADNPSNFVGTDLPIELVAPTKEGFSFEGWYTESNFVNRIVRITESKTYLLYAKWKNADGLTLTFADEFDDDELNVEKWAYQLGTGGSEGLVSWGNNEQQYYKEENVEVSDGTMKITAKAESEGGKRYTSARICTKNIFAQTYGRFEARIKLPSGKGYWPAFWLMPQDSVYGEWPYSGEIDIMEANCANLRRVNSTLHYGKLNGNSHPYTSGYVNIDSGNNITNFHTYAVEWREGEMKFFVDDKSIVFSINRENTDTITMDTWYTDGMSNRGNPAPFDQDFYIILNLAVGGYYLNNALPDANTLPAVMEVDYVRVFSFD